MTPRVTSEQIYTRSLTRGHILLGPDTRLHLAHMGLLKQKHAQTALPYASAYRLRQLAAQQSRMIWQSGPVHAPSLL